MLLLLLVCIGIAYFMLKKNRRVGPDTVKGDLLVSTCRSVTGRGGPMGPKIGDVTYQVIEVTAQM